MKEQDKKWEGEELIPSIDWPQFLLDPAHGVMFDSVCAQSLTLDPVQQLRQAMTQGVGSALSSTGDRETKLREMYQRMLLELQNRSLRERDKAEQRHKEEIQALVGSRIWV